MERHDLAVGLGGIVVDLLVRPRVQLGEPLRRRRRRSHRTAAASPASAVFSASVSLRRTSGVRDVQPQVWVVLLAVCPPEARPLLLGSARSRYVTPSRSSASSTSRCPSRPRVGRQVAQPVVESQAVDDDQLRVGDLRDVRRARDRSVCTSPPFGTRLSTTTLVPPDVADEVGEARWWSRPRGAHRAPANRVPTEPANRPASRMRRPRGRARLPPRAAGRTADHGRVISGLSEGRAAMSSPRPGFGGSVEASGRPGSRATQRGHSAEQLEPVGVDPVAAAAGDLVGDGLHAAVLDVGRPAAATSTRCGGDACSRTPRTRARRWAGRGARPRSSSRTAPALGRSSPDRSPAGASGPPRRDRRR